jgi:SAM-dependent methyltransferase
LKNPGTETEGYTQRLVGLQTIWWKDLLQVQLPYKWNIRRVLQGTVLEVGCGIGRNLLHLGSGAVGVDHAGHSLRIAKSRGLTVFPPEDFFAWADSHRIVFDNLLFAHVLEHLSYDAACALVGDYLGYLKPGGKIVIITPQYAGYKSDPTHQTFFDHDVVSQLMGKHGLVAICRYSFPFPQFFGRWFLYNEYISVWSRCETGLS